MDAQLMVFVTILFCNYLYHSIRTGRYINQEDSMDKPCLVIMAAGMGSRYGGLKQMDPMDEQGHIIMDFSVYDAAKPVLRKLYLL